VYLAARSKDKYQAAIDDIHASHPETRTADIKFLELDLSSAKRVKEAAEEFLKLVLISFYFVLSILIVVIYCLQWTWTWGCYRIRRMYAEHYARQEQALHLLYNNAGVMGIPKGTLAEGGYEYVSISNPFLPFSANPSTQTFISQKLRAG